MRKIALFAMILAFVACDSVAKYKDGIEKLATDWDGATELVTNLASKLTTAQESLNGMKSQMNLTEEIKSQLSEDALTAAMKYIGQFTGFSETLGNLSGEVFGFVSNWQEKAKEVQALKDGLAAGKIEGDVPAKINDLTTMVDEAKGKVSAWDETISNTTSEAETAYGQFKAILDAVAQPEG